MDKFMRKINTSPKPKPKFSPSRSKVFGVPLKLLLDSKSTSCIPAIVSNLCQCLLKNGTEVEGIFRINGSARLIELFKRDLEFSPNADLHPTENVEIYALAGVLKLFLRELPGGVVPEEYTLKLIKTLKGDGEDTFECIETLQEMIPLLPRENRRLLHYLCRFLNRISANESVNKMSCQGLGILFGPCVFRFDVRSQGLRNQGLVNQAMTVLIQHCGTVFLGDQMDETFALGDDLVDSWRSATSGVNADPSDLKVFSSATSCPTSSVSRSFYTTLFSGRSHERLTAESTNQLPGTDLPSVLGSNHQYKIVKPMMPAPWPNPCPSRLSNTDLFKTESTLTPQTAPGRLRVPGSTVYEYEHHALTLSSVSAASTSSGCSSPSPSSGLNSHLVDSESSKFAHDVTRISHSESCSNLPDDINFPDSSSQLALDLAHLLTSFGTANCLNFPSIAPPDEHSALLARRMDTRASQRFPSGQNGFHTSSTAVVTDRNGSAENPINTSRDSMISKPPLLVVPRPSTCGDHEPQTPYLYASDYEMCMYELPSLPDSCPSSTSVTTTAPSMTTAFTKGLSDSRTDNLSDLDFLRKIGSNSVHRLPKTAVPQQISSSCPVGGEVATLHCPPSGHLNQAISACLDAHIFATNWSVMDTGPSPSSEHKIDAQILDSSSKGIRTPRSHSDLNAYSSYRRRSPAESTSSFRNLTIPSPVSTGRFNPNSIGPVTTNSEIRGPPGKHPPNRNPHSPLDTAERICRPTALNTLTSVSTPVSRSASGQSRPKYQAPAAYRSMSAPLVYLSGPRIIRKPSWLCTHRKQYSRRTTSIHSPAGSISTPIARAQRNRTVKVGLRVRSPASNSAPPSPNPTFPLNPTHNRKKPTPAPRSTSCFQLPRAQDHKQVDSGRISARPNVNNRCETQTHSWTQTSHISVTRAHSFHDLPPRSKLSQVAVLPKSTSYVSLHGEDQHDNRKTAQSQISYRESPHPLSEKQQQVVRLNTVGSVSTDMEVNSKIIHATNAAELSKHHSDEFTPGTTMGEQSAFMEHVSTPASLHSFCELLTAVLAEQRRCCGRPSNLDEMSSEQIFQEKVDLQKGLLYFERLHGRPTESNAKRIMKPLYERYRQVKRMLRANLARSVLTATSGINDPIASSQVPEPPELKTNDRLLPRPRSSTTGTIDTAVSCVPDRTSPSTAQATYSGSVVERENSHLSAVSDYRLCDSAVSSLPASPKGEREPFPSAAVSPSTPLNSPLEQEVDAPSGPQGEHVASRYHPTITREELLMEWRLIWGKKRALQHELRDFETTIEQVKGRPPNKGDRRPMRDKYHEYRTLKRTLESLALRLNMEQLTGNNPADSGRLVRGSHCPPDSNIKSHTPTSAIRTP
ncbi:Protein FAM13A [Fasciola hepatica]|uniref:Protein FAM13A n=1 Tax=Fasciola hepatica TaxID=6192 RepID=A0A4E0R5U5_FASHE|nr:Protein FAM13A [Fasciola hepatica]